MTLQPSALVALPSRNTHGKVLPLPASESACPCWNGKSLGPQVLCYSSPNASTSSRHSVNVCRMNKQQMTKGWLFGRFLCVCFFFEGKQMLLHPLIRTLKQPRAGNKLCKESLPRVLLLYETNHLGFAQRPGTGAQGPLGRHQGSGWQGMQRGQ